MGDLDFGSDSDDDASAAMSNDKSCRRVLIDVYAEQIGGGRVGTRGDGEGGISSESLSDNSIQVFVNGDHKTDTFKVQPLFSVLKLKQMVAKKWGIPSKILRLIYGGKNLDDCWTLASCGVTNVSTIQAIIRGVGGFVGGGSIVVDEMVSDVVTGGRMKIAASVFPLFMHCTFDVDRNLVPTQLNTNFDSAPSTRKLYAVGHKWYGDVLGRDTSRGQEQLDNRYSAFFYREWEGGVDNAIQSPLFLDGGRWTKRPTSVRDDGTDWCHLEEFYEMNKDALTMNVTNDESVKRFRELLGLPACLEDEGVGSITPEMFTRLLLDFQKKFPWRISLIDGKYRIVSLFAFLLHSPLNLAWQTGFMPNAMDYEQLKGSGLFTEFEYEGYEGDGEPDLSSARKGALVSDDSAVNDTLIVNAYAVSGALGDFCVNFDHIFAWAQELSQTIAFQKTETTKLTFPEKLKRSMDVVNSFMDIGETNSLFDDILGTENNLLWATRERKPGNKPLTPEIFDTDAWKKYTADPGFPAFKEFCRFISQRLSTHERHVTPPFVLTIDNQINDGNLNSCMDPALWNCICLVPLLAKMIFREWYGFPWKNSAERNRELCEFLIQNYCPMMTHCGLNRQFDKIDGSLFDEKNYVLGAVMFLMNLINSCLLMDQSSTSSEGSLVGMVELLHVLGINGIGKDNPKALIALFGKRSFTAVVFERAETP